ncbi:putative phosphosugar-binding protein [Scopulibacillus darangshiensis]|uniref:UPF0309 protein EV207_10622 n=1 Tax=Scopulibacillus darangshiensis TaxID=442528 RepID=A0A4R2P5R3_9BACL|nr:SIS domain-containing protein [Scopulibacillus darangshiensis]TCP30199.1 putative phosphosugar-binding protein [Scopulibacillus darangshiensis]
MLSEYFSRIETIINQVKGNEQRLKDAASILSDAIKNDGLIHIFGCGHSHMISEEIFYRAGGLAPIHPIFIEELMLHKGAARSSELERKNNFIQPYLDECRFSDKDVLIVTSTSGINGVPIDAALYAKEKGVFVIAITSEAYSKSLDSRHCSGKRLCDVADLIIDNYSVKGDAIMRDDRLKQPFGPTSTVIGMLIINSIIVETVHLLAQEGITPPLFLSGNIQDADDHNQALIEKYKDRIPVLSKI